MNRYRIFSASLIALMLIGFGLNAQAQRVSLTANIGSFNIDDVSSGNTTVNYAGSSSVSLNARYYTKRKWAIRAGAGLDNLEYTVGNGIQTDYSAKRQDLKGVLGLEKHFMLGPLDIYPGMFVPMVIVGDDNILEQVRKQLEKIVTVVRVDDISSQDHVERDLMLIKVQADKEDRPEIRELTRIFRGRIVDVPPEEMMIELSGQEKKVEAFIDMMRPFGIIELCRTGRIAMIRSVNRPLAGQSAMPAEE